MRLRIFCVTVCFLFLPALAAAQQVQARFTAGVTSFIEDGLNNETSIGGSGQIYFTRHLSVEPELQYMSYGNFARTRNYLFWGNFVFDIRDRERRVVPYGFAAPGLIHSSTSFGSIHFSNNEAAFGIGTGVRVFLADRVFVAPQVRVGIAQNLFTAFTGSIGFVLKK